MEQTISSISELVTVMNNAKAGGQYVSIYGETAVKLNKFPTDGSGRVRINADFTPTKRFCVEYHFAQDYDKTMSKLLGEDYKASDANRIHLVKNVVMQYISTGNTCLIYMPESYSKTGTFLGGVELNDEQKEYMARYTPKHNSSSPLNYRTIGVKNVTKMVIGKVTYHINIVETETLAA